MKAKISFSLGLILLCAFLTPAQRSVESVPAPMGGWNVTYNLSNNVTNRMFFLQYSDRSGLFYFFGPRASTQVTPSQPGSWDKTTPTFISFSSEARIPVSNCCFDQGTLIFKGNISENDGVITGRVIFISDIPNPADPTGFVTRTGTFIGQPVAVIARNRRSILKL